MEGCSAVSAGFALPRDADRRSAVQAVPAIPRGRHYAARAAMLDRLSPASSRCRVGGWGRLISGSLRDMPVGWLRQVVRTTS